MTDEYKIGERFSEGGNNFVVVPARAGKEAQYAHNDCWPGDAYAANLRSLAVEAAHEAVKGMRAKLDEAIYAAFRQGMDYVVRNASVDFKREGPFTIAMQIKGGPVAAGTYEPGDLPRGWTLYRVADWIEGKRP